MKKIAIIMCLLVISLLGYSNTKIDGEDLIEKKSETIFREDRIVVEPWMVKPFINKHRENRIIVEPWMVNPFLDNGIDTPIYGKTNSDFGDYAIVRTEDVYHFQGDIYDVYNVYYDDPSKNMKIAVKGNKYIAYTSDYILFYECTKHGFGIRKVLFTSEKSKELFSPKNYSKQTILCKGRKIDSDKALAIIASFVPKLMA